ncbi:hypothetical protein C8F04DRAFT_1187449 [Mycena alexandri]|uniref:Uncharacterized protein n=1 Tax=Mycena alexandri TaxID=1745969 RepID=A0AAD6SLD9_9AGAR|nr:hypothetical protein C8F04DRAFT_1187449 [Mycena alexandri]
MSNRGFSQINPRAGYQTQPSPTGFNQLQPQKHFLESGLASLLGLGFGWPRAKATAFAWLGSGIFKTKGQQSLDQIYQAVDADETMHSMTYSKGEVFLARNFTAVRDLLAAFGFTQLKKIVVFVNAAGIKVLKASNWADKTFTNKRSKFLNTEMAVKMHWKGVVPDKGSVECKAYNQWQGAVYLWSACGPVVTGVIRTAVLVILRNPAFSLRCGGTANECQFRGVRVVKCLPQRWGWYSAHRSVFEAQANGYRLLSWAAGRLEVSPRVLTTTRAINTDVFYNSLWLVLLSQKYYGQASLIEASAQIDLGGPTEGGAT